MSFEPKLTGKILDPIHGIIRLTEIEIAFIDNPLFQRLRNIKQNTFLYKVFPSAMHSRFEHSLGVMHLSYEILNNMGMNSHRYKKKYKDDLIYTGITKLPDSVIQELRLAALLHDIGHGPMSHQFDSFMCSKEDFKKFFGDDYPQILELIKDGGNVEHEHISLLFIKAIFDSLKDEYKKEINIDNVLAIIEKDFKSDEVCLDIKTKAETLSILPLLTSIISSCPIDADRMDYLLRDSYFSGVKCGIYDHNRLFMSMVPVQCDGAIYLAYKESGLDSIVEFINSRANLFGQVYYHKTNRSFSCMLSKVCSLAKEASQDTSLFKFLPPSGTEKKSYLEQISDFYKKNSDDYFLNAHLVKAIEGNDVAEKVINDIVHRKPWRKVYESKLFLENENITDVINRDIVKQLELTISEMIERQGIDGTRFAIDIMTDNAFKDISKTEIKLLKKQLDGKYSITAFKDSNEQLSRYQSIKCFIRIFVHHSVSGCFDGDLVSKIENWKGDFLGKNELIKSISD
ncbi:HD domain-containing protein [Vibrio caribbeanicus]|uniref:HD domain-containing protein n=1 Tax=Vibrio caribbeanicus ATCC BAA-2122 TaxID=796620 RepID=E3BHB2_9VIBR|nr:HD domain-containing protein [Vibrio caribbeanicus]EFP97560.1 HD domain-containing protein [Vibrio caribbeanicus ATCC BAA-2122]